ncbi:MAG: HGGxSTG domain-containing protein [Dehalococcoidia bacterium]
MEAVAQVRAHAHRSFHQRVWDQIPKCGARTRSGRPCLGLIVRGRTRCRMHGGARGSGAQRGNQNRLLHGRYTRTALEQRALLRLVAAANAVLMADLRIVEVVARGAVEEFDSVVQRAAEGDGILRQAAARLERLLVDGGHLDEAHALADEVAELMATDHAPP